MWVRNGVKIAVLATNSRLTQLRSCSPKFIGLSIRNFLPRDQLPIKQNSLSTILGSFNFDNINAKFHNSYQI